MKRTVLLPNEDEVRAETKISVPDDSVITWVEVRKVLGLSRPTMRAYRILLAPSGNPEFIGIKHIEWLSKCVAWCRHGTATQQTKQFTRRKFRELQLRRQIDSYFTLYGIDWIPVWNELARAILTLNQ